MASMPRANGRTETWIALLGRRDTPTDGVEDYCTFLAEALAKTGVELKKVRMPWAEEGWLTALRQLQRESTEWRGRWVIVQYTALSWSRRGFPLPALAVLATLQRRGARIGVVFHEPRRQVEVPRRWIDRIRGACQDWVLRKLYERGEKCVFADPLDTVGWLPGDAKSVFIPIGANIPEAISSRENAVESDGAAGTVAVFGVTQYPTREREREVADISSAVRVAVAKGVKVKVVFVGRGTAEAAATIRGAFREIPAEVSVLGLLSAGEISRVLASCCLMLFVRGKVESHRGSVMAGIACGLPIVGYAGAAEGTPLAEAGVELVPYGDTDALGAALVRIFADTNLQRTLRNKSMCAQRKYFSWDTIAATFVRSLDAEVGIASD